MKHETPGTVYLLAGGPGSPQPDPLLIEAIKAVGREAPSVAYLGSASGDNRRFFSWMSASLKAAGAGTVVLVPTADGTEPVPPKDHAGGPTSVSAVGGDSVRILSSSDLIFVSGGDVEQGMAVLEKCRLIEPLRVLHRGGKPFIGVSAGSIMLCRAWVRWTDSDDDSTAQRFDCLGICPLICDTHAEADDWVELKTMLSLAGPGSKGFGISTGGGMVVHPDGRIVPHGHVQAYTNRSGHIVRSQGVFLKP